MTFAWPPSLPSVPTSRATRVTSSANEESWSTIALTVVPMRRNSPRRGRPSISQVHPLREVAVGDRVDHARDLGRRPDEVVDHAVDRVGRLAPGAAVARQRHALVEAARRGRRARRAATRPRGSSAGRRGRCTRARALRRGRPGPRSAGSRSRRRWRRAEPASNSRSVASSTAPFPFVGFGRVSAARVVFARDVWLAANVAPSAVGVLRAGLSGVSNRRPSRGLCPERRSLGNHC